MYSEYRERGLKILAFPCNQFLMQEPQGAKACNENMKKKYALDFDLLGKVHVNGKETADVFKWVRLKGAAAAQQEQQEQKKKDGAKQAPAPVVADTIKWNFNCFLVSRDGESCIRYSNSKSPLELLEDVERLLDADEPTPPNVAAAEVGHALS